TINVLFSDGSALLTLHVTSIIPAPPAIFQSDTNARCRHHQASNYPRSSNTILFYGNIALVRYCHHNLATRPIRLQVEKLPLGHSRPDTVSARLPSPPARQCACGGRPQSGEC